MWLHRGAGGTACATLHRRDNSKRVCRGGYFYAEMPDPIPSAHFFPFQTPIISSPRPSLPSRPSHPIQLIFSQSKYESTKINLSCLGIRSALPLWRRNGGLHSPATSPKPSPAAVVSFCLASVPGRTSACLCCQGSRALHVGGCLCRHPACCACTYMWGPLVIPRVAPR